MYMQEKTIRLFDVMNTQQVYIDFLHVIKEHALVFINTYELFIDATSATMNYKIQLFIIIEKFRHHIRLKKMKKKRHLHLIQLSQLTKTTNQTKTINQSSTETHRFERKINQFQLAYATKNNNFFIARILKRISVLSTESQTQTFRKK